MSDKIGLLFLAVTILFVGVWFVSVTIFMFLIMAMQIIKMCELLWGLVL